MRLSEILNHIRPLGSVSPNQHAHSHKAIAMPPKVPQKPPQAPPSFTATPASLIADAHRLCDTTRSLIDKIVAEVTPETATFDNVVKPMAQNENLAGLQTRIIVFYQMASANQALRDASTEAERMMDDFFIEASMREDIFKLVDAAYNKGEALDPESQRLLEKERKSYITNGLGIPAGPKRDRFKQIKKRLAVISLIFQKNLNEENGGIWFTKAQLAGVPEEVVESLAKGTGEHEGMVYFTFKYPDLFPTLKFATNAETRMKVFVANENKLPQNVPLFKEAVILRDEAARLMGYPDWASYKLEEMMSKNPKTVIDFLTDLTTQLRPGANKEIEHLLGLKAADLKARGLPNDGNYYLWDHRFYDRLMVQREYSVDERKIAEYFPMQSTVEEMLNVFSELFGLVFVEHKGSERDNISETGRGKDTVWHPDVKLFSVWDDEGEGGGFVGYLYLDLHPRPGKYGHASNFNLQPGFLYPNGSRRYPATSLMCNFSKPTPKRPSLMKHREMISFFHELGHGIHDLCGRTIYSKFHGTSVTRDFVEAPSQMLENWCWTPSQLIKLSNHWRTGEKIPHYLIEKLVRTKHVNDALFNLRQLHFGVFDMHVHTPKSHEDIERMQITETYNKLRTEISLLKGMEAFGKKDNWGNGQATFPHLIGGGGYDAGYYGYLSSQVYSADMFHTKFAADPMSATEGRRYRRLVLEKGGSQDEGKTLEEFLGSRPSSEAFYRELGLGGERERR